MSHVPQPVPKAPFVLLRGPLRDLANRAMRGSGAPRAQERIWIAPGALTRIYVRNPAQTPDFKRRHPGMVIGGDWDRQTEPLDQSWKIAACLARFRDGRAWEETGVFDRMQEMVTARGSFDSCHSRKDIRARYDAIDQLHASITAHGFRDDTVTRLGGPRLPGGVFVHIGRDGAPIFGAIGNHRVGIARALGLARIPAQLGVVHPGALASGALARFRGHRA